MRKKRKLSHSPTFFILLLLLVLLNRYLHWSNSALQETHVTLGSRRLPSAFHGFRIAQVSDLHNASFGSGNRELLDMLAAARPDLIAVTGDLIDSRRTDLDIAYDFLAAAVKIAPVYFITGNHEAQTSRYSELKERLADLPVMLLDDRQTTLTKGGQSLELLGVQDPSFSGQRFQAAESTQTMSGNLQRLKPANDRYTILLSHRPELMRAYVDNEIDLVLSGHAHGGQIRLPWLGPLVAPNQGLFPRYAEGSYTEQKTTMVVSRGLGQTTFPLRINNRPELVVITLLHEPS